MSTRTWKVRIDDLLAAHVADNIGANGRYAHAGDYIRDLIRRDFDCAEKQVLQRSIAGNASHP